MNSSGGSWWGWIVAAIVVSAILRAFGADIPVFPLILGAIILANVAGGRRGVSSHRHGHRPGHGHPGGRGVDGSQHGYGGHGPDHGALGPSASAPEEGGMPTIDVPRYPGAGQPSVTPHGSPTTPPHGSPTTPPLPPVPPPPYGSPPTQPSPYGAQPPPPPPHGAQPMPPPHYGAATGATPSSGPGAPHTSSDPVVSLGQLHLSRCGRDLQTAVQHGSAVEVTRVLDEIRDLSRRMQDQLDGADGTSGSGRREFQSGLRALDRFVEQARGEQPPGTRVDRVTQTCLRMGQTGRHE